MSYKLLSYLGYGNIIETSPSSNGRWWSTSLKNSEDSSNYTQRYIHNNYVNILPLLAYQKIYQDFFRWSQWENANPSSYNVDYYSGVSQSRYQVSSLPGSTSDYWKSDTMFDLKYCNWNKDMLMGVLPNSQFGDVAVLDISNSGDSNVVVASNNGTNSSRLLTSTGASNSANPISFIAADASSSNPIPVGARLAVNFSSLQSQFTVLALRQAEALQRWKEISQSGDSDYREQIRSILV